MTGSDYNRLLDTTRQRYLDAAALVAASLVRYRP
jgi:hypothetical protein